MNDTQAVSRRNNSKNSGKSASNASSLTVRIRPGRSTVLSCRAIRSSRSSRTAASPNPTPEIVAADRAGELLKIVNSKVGEIVGFNASRGVRLGKVVEVVPADSLPTTPGLRHIADKRRTPKTRNHESYVIVEFQKKPSRSTLFWPDALSINWQPTEEYKKAVQSV